MEVHRAPDLLLGEHLAEARRVLALPVEVSGLRWHPFGVYTLPLAKRQRPDGTWSRRLHVWHPAAEPVGETSAYGVHTHSGPARSHVVAGALQHHLYAFDEDLEGMWHTQVVGAESWRSSLRLHLHGATRAGEVHELAAQQPHGVTTPHGWAVSLFEQLDTPGPSRFTTWRRTDLPETPLVRTPPVPVRDVQRQALAFLDGIEVSA